MMDIKRHSALALQLWQSSVNARRKMSKIELHTKTKSMKQSNTDCLTFTFQKKQFGKVITYLKCITFR